MQKDGGTAPKDLLRLILRDARVIPGDPRFQVDADVWTNTAAACVGAAKADLFLHGRDAIDSRVEPIPRLVQRTGGLNHDGEAGPIIPRLAEVQGAAAQAYESAVRCDGIAWADPQALLRVLLVGRADVNEQALFSEYLRPRLRLHHVDGLDACHARHGAVTRQHGPALIDDGLIKPAAKRLESKKSLRRDLANHKANLIHMGGKHDSRNVLRLISNPRNERTDAVRLQRIRHWRKLAAHDRAHGPLMPRRPWRVGQRLKERALARVGCLISCHRVCSLNSIISPGRISSSVSRIS